MLAVRLYGKEDLRIEEMDRPSPGEGEVLVRVRAATTCGTDLKVYLRGSHAKMIQLPSPFGHEGAGEVAGIGAGVTGFREGDRVVWNNSAPCGGCAYCKMDDPSMCNDLFFLNGTYSEYLVIPARIVQKNTLHLPSGLPFERASMTEPLACVVHGAERIRLAEARSAVLLGDGAIGLFFVHLARRAGVPIYVIGGSEERLGVARALGAAGTFHRHSKRDPVAWLADTLHSRIGPDVVIEAVGQPSAWEESVRFVRPGGRVLLFGGCARDTTATFPTERLHYDAVTLQGVFHNTPRAVREALHILGDSDAAKLDQLLAPVVGLSEVPQAIERMRRREALKVPVQP